MEPRSKSLFGSVLKLLARKPRTKKEIEDWLNKGEVPSETQTEIIDKLFELKLLNDLEYACSFIRTRNLLKPKPKRVLRIELMRKGVSKADIEEALDHVVVDEVEGAKQILERQQWRWRSLTGFEKKRKEQEFLMRRGFPLDIIHKVKA